MSVNVRGLIIAAPASGSGKTLVTLGLLRSFARAGIKVVSAKVGPDYIDPVFHERASGLPCRNLDTWAMRRISVEQSILNLSAKGSFIICEGVMGMFDGAQGASPDSDGSTASLSRMTGWPIVLIVDAAAQAASVAALVRGFVCHDANVAISGVIFNRVASPSHGAIIREAMAKAMPDIPVFGCLSHIEDLELPSRHLGLVQASEHQDLPAILDKAANWIDSNLDINDLFAMAGPTKTAENASYRAPLQPLGQRIAIACDAAFSFTYPHVLEGWRNAGASIDFFSPLADQGPRLDADAVYLPGGYPELYAGLLAANRVFSDTMSAARDRGAAILGECGGYMVLGEKLTSENGVQHSMLGFLPVQTSFSKRKLKLGYRKVRTVSRSPLGPIGTIFRGHEFHYAIVAATTKAQPLFQAYNAAGNDMGKMGAVSRRVAGSFIHIIDCSE